MAGDVAPTPIAELIDSGVLAINDGYRAKNSELSSRGLPFARAQNINNGFHFEGADCFPEQDLGKVGNKISAPDDVVFTSKGTVGRFAFVGHDTPRFVYAPQLCFWRSLDRNRLHPRWLYYWMHSREFFVQFSGVAGQTDMAEYVSLRDQRRMHITVPPLKAQKAIACILGALDDKIELNRKMNRTLEATVRAIFCDMRRNKEGLQFGKIGDLCTLSRATVNPGRFPMETFAHYSIPAFDGGRLPRLENGEAIKSNKLLVPTDCLMISKLNPRIPRIWLPKVCPTRRSVASTEFLIAVPKAGITREWLYGLFSSSAFLDVFTTLITGTSGSHQRVQPASLLAMDLKMPAGKDVAEYTIHVKPLLERAQLNLEASDTLAALRDALLPALISGELRVPDAERIVGRAV